MHKHLFSISYILGMCLAICSCQGTHNEPDSDHGHKSDKAETENLIELSDAQAKTIGLKTETVRPGTFSGVIHVSGEIANTPGDEQTVVATADGIVSLLLPETTSGTHLQARQPLVALNSDRLQDGNANAKNRMEYEAARREYERASELVADQIISKKEYEQIRLRYEQARATYAGVAAQTTAKGVVVSSPITGYIKNCMARQGDYVTVGQPLFVITQTRRLQLRADVPESEATGLQQIHTAHFRTAASDSVYRLADLAGEVISYGRTLERGTAYLPVNFSFNNTGDIVPGSFAEVWLLTAPREGVVTVPTAAINEEQGSFFVYLSVGNMHYRKQEVLPGENNGLRTEILRGLRTGDKVVTHGAYEVKLAGATSAIPEHNHEH